MQFADSLPLVISIETRKAIDQSYSALRGFYRQYELIYISADERDLRLGFNPDNLIEMFKIDLNAPSAPAHR